MAEMRLDYSIALVTLSMEETDLCVLFEKIGYGIRGNSGTHY